MGLNAEEIKQIRSMLDEAERPMFFYDDDPDGLCSFLLLYRYAGRGRGVIVKSNPEMTEGYARYVDEYNPDVIFVLDKPILSQEFVDRMSVPVVWIDHHALCEIQGVYYFNPKKNQADDLRPTTYWAYEVTHRPEDIWIAVAGCLGDWYVPPYLDQFCKDYQEMLEKPLEKPEEILYGTILGSFVRWLTFALKGKAIQTNINVLTRIVSPDEILNQTTARGKYLYKKIAVVAEEYDALIETARKDIMTQHEKPVCVFMYEENNVSLTSELSNELMYRFPDKIIVVARRKNGQYRCSLRSMNREVDGILADALMSVKGYGGGHKHACGASIDADDFDMFIQQLTLAVQ